VLCFIAGSVSIAYAMKVLQQAMKGEAEKAGLDSEESVADMIMKMRIEEKVTH